MPATTSLMNSGSTATGTGTSRKLNIPGYFVGNEEQQEAGKSRTAAAAL